MLRPSAATLSRSMTTSTSGWSSLVSMIGGNANMPLAAALVCNISAYLRIVSGSAVAPMTNSTGNWPPPGSAGLDEADAFLKKSVGENQAAVLQVRLEGGQLGDGFALGIDERLFVPRHAPAPGHLQVRETVVFRDDDRPQVGGPDVAARHKAENEDLVAQL